MSDSTVCSGCGKAFKSRGLTKHQGLCPAYAQLEQRRLARWRDQHGPTFVPFGQKRRRTDAGEGAQREVVNAAGGVIDPPVFQQTTTASPPPLDFPISAEVLSDEPVHQSRPQRANRGRLPARFRDNTPEGPAPLPALAPPTAAVYSDPSEQGGLPDRTTRTRTVPNRFGLLREYWGPLPEVDPEDELDLDALLDDSLENRHQSAGSRQILTIAPYPNISAYLFGRWFWNGTPTKSEKDRADLLEHCILHPDFKPDDLRGLNWKKIDQNLSSTAPESESWGSADGWKFSEVTLDVPLGKSGPLQYSVPGLAYRPLEELISTVCASELSAGFHYTPYQLLWKPPMRPDGHDPPVEKVYGEVYSSRAFLDAHEELQRSPREPGCDLPRAIIAIMPWSDSTHLAEYGNASLWPIYVQFGNQSKYIRGRPSSNACHHVAYIPKLPSDIEDLIHLHTQLEGVDKILTHCRRELMQGVWRVLLSDGFIHACQHGIVVKCYDGVTRRLYPRFFTYSADYPEKVLLATIRDMGNCPCPRCLVAKDAISAVGTASDMNTRVRKVRVDDADRRFKVARARSFIYDQHRGIGSKAVEELLKPESLVPTINVFSERLGPWLPNFHTLFVPDFLHEWELGVWKNMMTHLIRILHAEGGSVVREFNSRFRQVPVFGRDTIRRMSSNVSEMKQMAARDFEDALQSFIPVIDRLLPSPHNSIVLDLVFDTATVHALHKLRLHVDSTISVTKAFFVIFTTSLRRFKRITCSAYQTTELPKETQARMRRQVLTATKASGAASGTPSENSVQTPAPGAKIAPRRKEFNINTYKVHSLGDYPSCIVHVGTMDSHTTQTGELEHCITKRRFARTSKKDFIPQMTNIERRESRLEHMAHQLACLSNPDGAAQRDEPLVSHAPDGQSVVGVIPAAAPEASLSEEHIEGENAPLTERYWIGRSQKVHEYLPQFVKTYLADPAAKDFIPRLKRHLLRRITLEKGQDSEECSFSDEQMRGFLFEHDRLYRHQIMRVNYTTYDVRRAQDIIHIGTDHCYVMVHANEDESTQTTAQEPVLYWYAKVLGIYHVNVLDNVPVSSGLRPQARRYDFLHIRWFGRDPDWESGWTAKRLERIGFVPQSDEGAFDFLDPADVLRGCHLIPAFAEGRTRSLLGPSVLARPASEATDNMDWERYYVNRFVDRDMFMRYLGGAVGHGTLLVPSILKLSQAQPEEPNEFVTPRTDGMDATVIMPQAQGHASTSTATLASAGMGGGQDGGLDDDRCDDDNDEDPGDDADYDSDVPFALL